MGFIATPLTTGLLFNHLALPAFPNVFKKKNWLETIPIVQKQEEDIIFCLPEQNFTLLNLLLTSRIVEKVPADLLI